MTAIIEALALIAAQAVAIALMATWLLWAGR